MSWILVADSSCDLISEDKMESGIPKAIVPLSIRIGEDEFVDDDRIDVEFMLAAMKREKRAATTACPSPQAFVEAFEKAEHVICFTISSGVSGTYNSAMTARSMVLEANPKRNIHVMDTKGTAGVMLLLLQRAEKLISEGNDFESVCTQLEKYKDELQITFVLSTYDNLIKAGRMSAFTGALVKGLGIYMIAKKSAEGTIALVKKVKGESRTLKAMIEQIRQTKDISNKPVIITHCKNETGAKLLKAMLEKELNAKNVRICVCRGLTSFYACEKGLLVSY